MPIQVSSLITCTNLKHISAYQVNIIGQPKHDEAISLLPRKTMQLQALDIGVTGPIKRMQS